MEGSCVGLWAALCIFLRAGCFPIACLHDAHQCGKLRSTYRANCRAHAEKNRLAFSYQEWAQKTLRRDGREKREKTALKDTSPKATLEPLLSRRSPTSMLQPLVVPSWRVSYWRHPLTPKVSYGKQSEESVFRSRIVCTVSFLQRLGLPESTITEKDAS